MSQFQQKNFIHTTQVQPTVVPANPRLATVGQFIAVVLIWSLTLDLSVLFSTKTYHQ